MTRERAHWEQHVCGLLSVWKVPLACTQVGTWDGRVKLYGKAGVERTVYSACTYAYGTKQLEFLPYRGVLVRLSEVP